MTDKLLHDKWGDNGTPYTPEELAEARARFRRRDTITLIIALLVCAAALGQILHYLWPNQPCVQLGEYTCVETAR
jgi:hypothetical protein